MLDTASPVLGELRYECSEGKGLKEREPEMSVDNEVKTMLARVDERTMSLSNRTETLSADIKEIRNQLSDLDKKYVSHAEFFPLKKLFNGVILALVLLLLNAVASRMIGK